MIEMYVCKSLNIDVENGEQIRESMQIHHISS